MPYAIVETGMVINIVCWDGQDPWSPQEGQNAIEIKDGVDAGIGYSVVDGEFVPPVAIALTQAELVSEAEHQKKQLLRAINDVTQMWQTQLSLGIITDADKATLILWMKYAQEVSAIDTNSAPDIVWPQEPVS